MPVNSRDWNEFTIYGCVSHPTHSIAHFSLCLALSLLFMCPFHSLTSISNFQFGGEIEYRNNTKCASSLNIFQFILYIYISHIYYYPLNIYSFHLFLLNSISHTLCPYLPHTPVSFVAWIFDFRILYAVNYKFLFYFFHLYPVTYFVKYTHTYYTYDYLLLHFILFLYIFQYIYTYYVRVWNTHRSAWLQVLSFA